MQLTHALSWTEEQLAGQKRLQDRLQEARRAPVEGNPVPEEAQRAGTLDD
ncbi:hypothetical protein [Streptomyces violaceusniger]|uniref:Uncharacterized protein n=1 Tax=Streptomyces violaceusniger (strain Tu 4113) TaxID=653045 RepID=G2PHS0_STRV4|nr:hypothetical protein [Streptomyces violaceusniger]AEM88871.1 hypothetical protein Strvi_0095 [Streptomyces violaceusniger Tu 4113]